MATMRTFLPTPTKFGNRKVEFWNGRPGSLGKPEPAKHRGKASAGSLQKRVPQTEEEYVEYYQDRIFNAQRRQLYPLQEDLADWLNKTLGIEYITGDNFLDMLDNGVILCQLARVIHERAQHAIDNGLHKGPIPELNGRCFENAARRSFFSRDNMENFIKFCKHLGVHQNLLFESDDLVLQNQPRNVVLCLLELSRITTKFNMEPPGLVQLEKEIAEEEQRAGRLNETGPPLLSWQFRSSPNNALHSSLANRIKPPRVASAKKESKNTLSPENARSASEGSSIEADTGHCQPVGGSDGVPSDHTEDDWSRGSAEDPDSETDGGQTEIIGKEARPNELNELDRKVAQATKIAQKHCHCDNEKCSKLAVKKVGDGKYNIAGRNVFVRLLKGRHMMVRVGGGWDTLEHFLLRHDPCQVRIMSRGMSPGPGTQQRHSISGPVGLGSLTNLQMLARTPSTAGANTFLHIRAKYRSPPPP